MKYIYAFICISILSFAAVSHGVPLKISEGKVEFLALGNPGALKIKGRSGDEKAFENKYSVEGTTESGSSSLKLDSLNTGIELRDKHMKEKYLEVAKFPLAEFKLTSLKLPEGHSGKDIPFQGTLKLHGVEKQVSGKVSSEKKDNNLTQNFNFRIKTGDFGIVTPNFMGVTMADEVDVTVNLKGSL